jgi:uncharacterized protein (DUF1499 family)
MVRRRALRIGLVGNRLRDCPYSPNCVCSDAVEESHRVAPFTLAAPPNDAWRAVRAAVSALPRTRIVKLVPDYLHAECRSAILGFVDDLELHLRPDAGIVAVRSASRIGYSDLGVNRSRVERLRADLVQRGAIAAPQGTAAGNR